MDPAQKQYPAQERIPTCSTGPATHIHDGTRYYFCSDRCHDRFVADPGKYVVESVGGSDR